MAHGLDAGSVTELVEKLVYRPPEVRLGRL